MPSGSDYTVSGGTTMTGVNSGDVIEDGDFNNMRTNVNTLMGSAADVTLSPSAYAVSNVKGWGQGGAGVNAASAGGLIYADNATGGFKRLQDDIHRGHVCIPRCKCTFRCRYRCCRWWIYYCYNMDKCYVKRTRLLE